MYGRDIVAPPGNQAATENTNISLQHWESPVYSTNIQPNVICRPIQHLRLALSPNLSRLILSDSFRMLAKPP
jgi:hypothetical protein